jgi:hypothetical protein
MTPRQKFENIMSTIYRRDESNWAGSSASSKNVSTNYWRRQVREAFARYPAIEVVEVVKSGRKTDSQILQRGSSTAPGHAYVIVASTGGSWGKSRRDFHPAN